MRPWLRRWQPYAACGAGLALFAPVILWNAGHAWAGFIKQGGRVGDWRPARALGFLAELIGGQIGLATPFVWVLCLIGLVTAVQRSRRGDPAWSLLAALSVPAILVFLQHAIGDRVQGNWPAIIYPALTVAAAAAVADRRWINAASCTGFAITLLAYAQAVTEVIPLPPGLDPVAIRLAGWDGLARQVAVAAAAGNARFVAVEGYAPGSEIAWTARDAVPVVGLDDRWGLIDLPRADIAGQQGLLARDARRTDAPDPGTWTSPERIATVTRPGSGAPGYALWRVTAGPGERAAVLPDRR
jgi:hypothetical protein